MKFSLGFFDRDVGPGLPNPRKPFIHVKINPNDDAKIDWSAVKSYDALVDTGADLCVFDSKLIDPSTLTPISNVAVKSAQTGSNTSRDVLAYRMAILMPNALTKVSLTFVPIDMDASLPFRWILGADFLNLCGVHIFKGSYAGYLDFET